ncbi:class I SAM-dependent methyltransferase [Rhodovibrio salinarum]|uniref:Class I SAM-dependent methyltransferase n=1 Tax=Rhodovibrio salinarum TaxID=1087 RepID=A0A934QHK2_9PROT|nr:class I SAM-dependent methyltransferase [Rhodovibrio salinarum]MBK1696907.1 class I SAM-dependent methyltransferase [Rhodovibrio salinarum]
MTAARPTLRRLIFGLSTVLGLKARGIFIPYRHADRLPEPGRRDAYPQQGELLRGREPAMRGWLDTLDGLDTELRAIPETGGPPEPRWRQGWFAPLDAAMAYTVVRTRKPRRIVEVGSGHSTRFLARAARDGGLETQITCIDPAPRATLEGQPVHFRQETLQEAGLAAVAELLPGDLLFIDSSHVLAPGSDVDLVLTQLLAHLPQGALVHLHDIFLPDDYPADWAWRGYNEQSGIAPILTSGWRVLFASHYAATRMTDRVQAGTVGRLPTESEAIPSSLWLEKTAGRL